MKLLKTLGWLVLSAAAGGLLAYGAFRGLGWLVPLSTLRLVFGAPAGAAEAFAKLGAYLLALWVALAAALGELLRQEDGVAAAVAVLQAYTAGVPAPAVPLRR